MHIKYKHQYWDILYKNAAVTIPRQKIWECMLDGTVGYGKTKEQALEILAQNLNCKLKHSTK